MNTKQRAEGDNRLVMLAAAGGVSLAAFLTFLLRRWMIAVWLRLRPPRHRVRVTRDVPVLMPDGVTLMADLYAPAVRRPAPTLLIRTPYGRNRAHGWFGLRVAFVARRFAERGYQVVTQDVRGRFDSGGVFEPYVHERADGLATLAWIRQQPWFDGRLGMWGPSYLGLVQWAVADAPEVKAIFPMITSSQLHDVVFPDGAFDVGLILRWLLLLELGQQPRYRSLLWGMLVVLDMEWRFRRAKDTLPLTHADERTGIQPPDYYRRWLEHTTPDDPFWDEMLHGADPVAVRGQVHLLGGWYDFFLRGLLRDYAALKAAGHPPRLTIGPWYHFSHLFLMWNTLDYALRWFDASLQDMPARPRNKPAAPVRLYVMGANTWRTFSEYPPPAVHTHFYLDSAGGLTHAPHDTLPDEFDYDPAHPTPAWAGAQFSLTAGPRNNRRLERRPDVLVYTSAALEAPLEIIGAVRLVLYVRSSLENSDFYGRLCVVATNGRSMNLCDGLTRVRPDVGEVLPDGVRRIEVDLWATAYRFNPGQRLRLVIAGGAHPRWNRHTGGDNPLTDSHLRPAHQIVYHDLLHPSMLVLPVVQA